MRRYLALVVLAFLATAANASAQQPPPSKIVRLFAVKTGFDSGFLDPLIADFQAKSGYKVRAVIGQDAYKAAMKGDIDVVLSHYRHDGLGAFVMHGYGLWPEVVMANVTAFLAPSDDPAHIKGLTDGIEIFRRIAAAKAPFIVNGDPNSRYLLATLWNAAGQPDRQGWYIDANLEGLESAKRAAQQHAYSMWGVTAFMTARENGSVPLDIVVPTDSLMQRVMVCVVVNPAKFPHVNVTGAKALQTYLLLPETQARIEAFRYAGIDQPVFLPAGRNNENPVLQAVTNK